MEVMAQSLKNMYIHMDLDHLKFWALSVAAIIAIMIKTCSGDKPIKYQKITKHTIICAAASA